MHRYSISARNRSGWIKPVAVIGCAVGSVLAAALAFAWIAGPGGVTPTIKLDIALRQMQKGDIQDAARFIDGIDAEQLEADEDRSKFNLIKGVRAYDKAAKSTLKQSYFASLEEADKLLSKSNELKFPAGFEGIGNYYFGKTLNELNRPEEAKPFLKVAIDRLPQSRFDAIQDLVNIQLTAPLPKVQEVEKTIDRWTRFPAITQEKLDLAQLALARLRLASGKTNEAIETAQAIAVDSRHRPDADLLIASIHWDELWKSIVGQSETQEITPELRREVESVVERLVSVMRAPTANPRDKLRAKYLQSLCYRALGRNEEAISALSSLRTGSPQTIESVAAAVEEIDLLAELQRWDDAIGTLRQMSNGFGEVRWYTNTWRPLAVLREKLLGAANRFLDGEAFDKAVAFSDNVPAFVKDEDRLRLRAPAYRGWAEMERAKGQVKAVSTTLQTRQNEEAAISSQKLFAQAGRNYEQLSNTQLIAVDYPDLLWSAIECYELAKDYVRSTLLLDRYLDIQPRDTHPKALLKKAGNFFELGQTDAAIEALRRCVASMPNHPLAYEARLQTAKILLDQFKYDGAAEQLLANLYDGNLTPESQIWRDSLFEVGLLYCRSGIDDIAKVRSMYDSASLAEQKNLFDEMQKSQAMLLQGIQRLEEAIQRYPDDPRIYYCLYRIAEGYRIAAEWPKLQLNTAKLASVDSRENHRQERDALLGAAQKAYGLLRDKINQTGDLLALDSERQRMLRNSYLGEADLMYETLQYEQALQTYRNAANRFLTEPIALEALTRAAQCSQQLGRNDEALRTLNQASDLLSRLDASNPNLFAESTRGSKENWASFLDWMKTNL